MRFLARHWLRVSLVVVGIFLVLVVWRQTFLPSPRFDAANPPQFIQADFIDLDKISSISKFRSGAGHDFSGKGEACRSMKHYFMPREIPGVKDQNGMPPKPDGQTDISIYSPIDGKIISVEQEQTPIGSQIYIRSTKAPDYTVRLFHIYLNDGLGKGAKVTAGQRIGVIGQYQNTDIAVVAGGFINSQLLSYFQVMPDSIFAKYQARGVKTRDDFIISKAQRDANPLKCNGEQFAENYFQTRDFAENYVELSAVK